MQLQKHLIADLGWLNKVHVNLSSVNATASNLSNLRELKDENRAAWLLRAITCIDLTTLGGDDTESNVTRLCFKVIFVQLLINITDTSFLT